MKLRQSRYKLKIAWQPNKLKIASLLHRRRLLVGDNLTGKTAEEPEMKCSKSCKNPFLWGYWCIASSPRCTSSSISPNICLCTIFPLHTDLFTPCYLRIYRVPFPVLPQSFRCGCHLVRPPEVIKNPDLEAVWLRCSMERERERLMKSKTSTPIPVLSYNAGGTVLNYLYRCGSNETAGLKVLVLSHKN